MAKRGPNFDMTKPVLGKILATVGKISCTPFSNRATTVLNLER